jgi:branched-chain amino acid transport system permease protein
VTTGLRSLSGPGGQSWRTRLVLYGTLVLIGVIFILLPPFASAYVRSAIVKIFIYGIFALSLNLLFGYTGLFSLGHAAFFGVGAYTAAILMANFGIDSFWLVLVAGLVMAILAAALFGVIALRVSGIYFLLVTLAIGQLLYAIAVKWRTVTGGSNGLVGLSYPKLGIPGFHLTSTSFYYLVLVFFAVSIFLMYRVVKSPFGRALQGIRGDERRMQSLGYNTWLYKYIIFIVGGLFAGLAGILYMYQNGFVGPGYPNVFTSTTVMLMVILGSALVFWGPIVGAAVVVILEYFASIYVPERWPLILGAAFVLAVLFLRGGAAIHLLKLWGKVKRYYGSA